MSDTHCHIRHAGATDAAAVADLVSELAQSFTFSRAGFDRSYPALLASGSACLLLAVDGHDRLGYLLGFEHLTFTPTRRWPGSRKSSSAARIAAAASAGP